MGLAMKGDLMKENQTIYSFSIHEQPVERHAWVGQMEGTMENASKVGPCFLHTHIFVRKLETKTGNPNSTM